MVYIISGTNRKESRTLQVSQIVKNLFEAQKQKAQIVDLSELPFEELLAANYGKSLPASFASIIFNLNTADGLYIVTPEYNGSMPGALKYFIDHFSYPETFEFRPVAFTGLGGRWGGLRPVEHLQQVFSYRNGFIFPQRVFISNVWDVLKDGQIQDANVVSLLVSQVDGFVKYIRALKTEKLDANSRR
jgi:NAD(P)H-dependent FMN reductase